MTENLPVKASTQDHIDIEDIIDDLVLLKDGTAALILQTTALNFGLLSEPEQDAVIYSYSALLNSLTFSIQIVIRSKRSDVSDYLEKLSQAEQTQTNQDLRNQIAKYRNFIVATVAKNDVLEKKFYLVIPFSFFQLGARGTLVGLSKKQKGAAYSKKYLLEQAKNELLPKRDHLLKQLARIGVTAHQLTNHELIELFYDIYNPSQVGLQKVTEEAGSYTTPIVQPAIEGQILTTASQGSASQTPVGNQIPNQGVLGPKVPIPSGQPPIPSQTGVQSPQNQAEVLAKLQSSISKASQLLERQKTISSTEEKPKS